jgi:hypothetical protein
MLRWGHKATHSNSLHKETKMKKIIITMAFFIFLFISFSCGTPVSEYEPKNQAEKEIKALLIEYLNCRNKHDLDGLLALFHDDVKLKFALFSNYVTKGQLREIFPDHFESFPTVEFTNAKMEVAENKALVNCKVNVSGAKLKGIFDLVKENDRWLFIKYTTEGEFAVPR